MKNIVLPLGISFYLYPNGLPCWHIPRRNQSIQQKRLFAFVTIFPHLIAGPILYHRDMIPQFSQAERYKINYKNLTYGILWFTIGLFKKLLLLINWQFMLTVFLTVQLIWQCLTLGAGRWPIHCNCISIFPVIRKWQ